MVPVVKDFGKPFRSKGVTYLFKFRDLGALGASNPIPEMGINEFRFTN